jgi:uncharacterized membrane protein/outer membrane protein assembly factor BamB
MNICIAAAMPSSRNILYKMNYYNRCREAWVNMMSFEHARCLFRFLAAAMVVLAVVPPTYSFPDEETADGPSPGTAAAPQYGRMVIPNLMWPMFGKDAQHTANAGGFARRLSDPMLLWGTAGSIESHGMAVGNFSRNIVLNNTGAYERQTLHAVFAQNGQATVAEASTGRTMWQAPLGGALLGAPALADFNGNGRLDFVVTSSIGNVSCYEPDIEWNGTQYSWSSNLSYQRLWDRSLGGEASYTSAAAGDVTGDGTDDLAVCAGHTLYVLDGRDGSISWNASLPGNIATSPILVKYGTGGLWVAVQSFNYTGITLDRTHLSLFSDKGVESWNKSLPLSTLLTTFLSLPSPAAADTDGDGLPEMAIVTPFESGNGRLYAFEQDGSRLLDGVQLKGQVEAPPAIGDINGDSFPDIVTASWNFTLPGNGKAYVAAFDGRSGGPLWSSTIDRAGDILMTERAVAGPVVADLSRDGRLDVVVGLFNGRIYALNGTDGSMLWEYNSTRASMTSSPAVADIQPDGFPEVLQDGLVIDERIGDLVIVPGDISFSNESPAEGTNVSVTAFVRNNGTKDLRNVDVLFSDIYDNTTAWTARRTINVSAGGSFGATVTWTAQGGGRHRMTIAADPDNAIEEISEQNNNASRPVTVASRYTLEVTCAANESYVDAGQDAAYMVRVRNAGDVSNTVNLTVTGLAPGWSSNLSQSRMTLGANESQTVTVRIDSPSDATAGPFPANLTARSDSSPSNRATVVLTTRVRGLFGVLVDPRSNSSNAMPDDWITYVFNVSNTGNSDDTLVFANTSPPEGWMAQLDQDQISLPGRSHTLLSLLVHPPYTATEGEEATIHVTANSTGDPSKSDMAVVRTTVVLPDLAVESIKFYRADGKEADGSTIHLVDGGNATINVTVRNIRQNVQVGGIWVEVTEGAVSLGHDIIPILPLGSFGTIEIPWKPAEGLHSISAMVDSGRTVSESNEDNNNLTAGMLVKSSFTSGAYVVSGTVTQQGGAPVPSASVTIKDERTGQGLALQTDGTGRYSTSLNALAGGYEEEDRVTVSASNGITTCSTSFLAYSEDGGKTVDIELVPGPYDFYLTAERISANTDPMAAATYKIWFNNLGSGNNTIVANLSAPAAGWTAVLENSSGVRTGIVYLGPRNSPGASESLTLSVSPPADALAGTRQQLRLAAVSTDQSGVKHTIDTVTTVNQLFAAELSFEKGPSLKPGDSGRFNLTVRNAGNGNDTFDLSFTVPSGLAGALDRSSLQAGAFGSVSTWLAVNASTNAVPGTYNISVSARSRIAPSAVEARGNLSVTVDNYIYKLQLNGGVAALEQQETGTISFSARNAGNMRDTYSLSVRPDTPDTLPAGWTYSIRRNGTVAMYLTLEPGELVPLELFVEPPLEMPGMSSIRFNVSGYSQTEPDKSATTMLTLSIERPDLLLIKTVRSSVSSPRDGQKLRLTVTVMNQGIVDSPAVTVRFFDGSSVIGDATAPGLAVNAQTDVSVNWTAKGGTRTIRAAVNPASNNTQQVFELSYANNDVTTPIIVEKAGSSVQWALIGAAVVAVIAVAGGYHFFLVRGGKKRRSDGDDEQDLDEEYDEEDEDEQEAEDGEEGGEEKDGEEAAEEQDGEEGGEEDDGDVGARGPPSSRNDRDERAEGAHDDGSADHGESDETEDPGQDEVALQHEEEDGDGEVHEVEAVHVVEEETRPHAPVKKMVLKKGIPPGKIAGAAPKKGPAPPQKKARSKRPPPAAEKEVEMPSVIRIG